MMKRISLIFMTVLALLATDGGGAGLPFDVMDHERVLAFIGIRSALSE